VNLPSRITPLFAVAGEHRSCQRGAEPKKTCRSKSSLSKNRGLDPDRSWPSKRLLSPACFDRIPILNSVYMAQVAVAVAGESAQPYHALLRCGGRASLLPAWHRTKECWLARLAIAAPSPLGNTIPLPSLAMNIVSGPPCHDTHQSTRTDLWAWSSRCRQGGPGLHERLRRARKVRAGQLPSMQHKE
jgi:hypothetical protein